VVKGFPSGAESARAAECAAEQERFWEMHDLLY
jgi:protein-disulfide isomerase